MTGPRRNIELKARCADLAAARAASERCGARCVHVEAQRDTFFQAASGRLKLRERTWRNAHGAVDRSEAELIGYRREDVAGVRESRYTVVPVPDPRLLAEALGSTVGIRGVVAKRRELWMFHNVRIHLDDVEGLGAFVEFEAVLFDGETEPVALERLAVLQEGLGIMRGAIVAGAYADLLGI